MAIIKKSSDVLGGGGWLEAFQFAYGITEMGYKFHKKKLDAENYVTDSIGKVVSSFRNNPTNIDINNTAIDSLERIGKTSFIDPNSKAGILWQQAYKQLKSTREDTVQIHQKLGELTGYAATKYIDIPNKEGWEPIDVRDNSGNIIKKASTERSETVKTINEDIIQLGKDKQAIHAMGRLDSHTKSMFDNKIKELQHVKSWVGYDGKLKQQDLTHMDNKRSLIQQYEFWEKQYSDLEGEWKLAQADLINTNARLNSSDKSAFKNDEYQANYGIPNQIARIENDKANIQSLLDRYGFDYGMINKPIVELTKEQQDALMADEGFEAYGGGISAEALSAYASSDTGIFKKDDKKEKIKDLDVDTEEETSQTYIAATVQDTLSKYVTKGKLGPLERFSKEGSVILPEKKEVHLAISGFGQQMEQSEGMIKNLQYQDRKGEWKPRDANKLKREARKFKEILKDVKNVVENIDSSSSKTNKRIYKKLKRFVYHQKELAGPQTPFVVGGGTGAYDFDPEIKEIIDSIDIPTEYAGTSASDVAKATADIGLGSILNLPPNVSMSELVEKLKRKMGGGMLTGGSFLKQF